MTKSLLFNLIFSVWFMLLVLLGDTHLSYYLFGSLAVILTSFFCLKSHFQFVKIVPPKLLVAVFLLVLIPSLSLFTTQNVPKSLYQVCFYSLATLLFVFIYKAKWIQKKELFNWLQLVIFILLLINFVFFFKPGIGESIPGFNLIFSSYGHNHLAILLLLILPFSWLKMLANLKENSKIETKDVFFPLIFTFGLFFSFGRLALFLGGMEMAAMYYLSWKWRIAKNFQWLKHIFIILLSIFILLIGLKFYLSFSLSYDLKFDQCPFPQFEKQLCKPITKEPRPEYWSQAISVIKHYPWTGTGIGTYPLVVKKHISNPEFRSAHAHNTWLKLLAELGLAGGGLFVVVMFYLFYLVVATDVQRQKFVDNWADLSITLALIVVYINAFLDFDLSFVSVYSLTLALLSLGLRSKRFDRGSNKVQAVLEQSFILGLSIFLIVISSVYALANYYVGRGKIKKAFDTFPYFHWHSLVFARDLGKTDPYQKKLTKIYDSNSKVILSLQEREQRGEKRKQLLKVLVEADPWSVLDTELLDYFLEDGQWNKAETELKRLAKLNQQRVETKESLELAEEINQAKMKLAQGYFSAKNYSKAGKLFNRAYQQQPWIIDEFAPINDKVSVVEIEQVNFVKQVKDIPGEHYGYHRDDYADFYINLTLHLVKKQKTEDLNLLISKVLEMAEWKSEKLFNRVHAVVLGPEEEGLAKWDEDRISNQQQVIAKLAPYSSSWKKEIKERYLQELQRLALKAEETNDELVVQVLDLFSQVYPESYWAQIQKAHFLFYLGKTEKAYQEYQRCQRDFPYHHDEAQHFSTKIEEQRIKPQGFVRYHQVAEIILGNKE